MDCELNPVGSGKQQGWVLDLTLLNRLSFFGNEKSIQFETEISSASSAMKDWEPITDGVGQLLVLRDQSIRIVL